MRGFLFHGLGDQVVQSLGQWELGHGRPPKRGLCETSHDRRSNVGARNKRKLIHYPPIGTVSIYLGLLPRGGWSEVRRRRRISLQHCVCPRRTPEGPL